MSTATIPTSGPFHGGVRLLTAADVAALPRTLPSGGVKYELHDGRLIVIAPPGDQHAKRQARFAALLYVHGEQPGHGETRAEVGVLLRRNPDLLLAPDAAFLTTAQLPPLVSPEGYL